jgi:hypothetical protein
MSWFSKGQKRHTLTISVSNSYDSTPQIVPVNTERPINLSSNSSDIQLCVRIRGFLGSSKHQEQLKSSSYFQFQDHRNISIQLSLTPKQTFTGDKLLFGNDFGTSIREFLPYGTNTGLRLFKRYVDPSVDGDLYADEPYLYGKALSSFNVINDNLGTLEETGCQAITENLQNTEAPRYKLLIPTESGNRQVFFQSKENLEKFEFQKGHTYQLDFFSGLISLEDSNFQIKLPGFQINLTPYLNDKFNSVRYVLKLGSDAGVGVQQGEPMLVLTFELESDEICVDEEDHFNDDEIEDGDATLDSSSMS